MLAKPKIIHRGPAKERKDTHTSFRLQRAVLARLDEIAALNGVTRNNLVAVVLHDYVTSRSKPTINPSMRAGKSNGQAENVFD